MDKSSPVDGTVTKEAATVDGEDAHIQKLGFSLKEPPVHTQATAGTNATTSKKDEAPYKFVPNPDADEVDLSDLRGTKAPTTGAERLLEIKGATETDDDLNALAEIVPEVRARARDSGDHVMTMEDPETNHTGASSPDKKAMGVSYQADDGPIEVQHDDGSQDDDGQEQRASEAVKKGMSVRPGAAAKSPGIIEAVDSMQVQEGRDSDEEREGAGHHAAPATMPNAGLDAAAAAYLAVDAAGGNAEGSNSENVPSSKSDAGANTPMVEPFSGDQSLKGFDDDAINSDKALNSDEGQDVGDGSVARKPPAFASSGASLSTATQTHEVRMPMYLPTFKPATGCTNASDFIVRCFVARLRSGITVVKHGRSRWCKSRLRILHIHPDGRSLSWKPAVGEPTSSKRPPKLDLSTCTEVRHAWSPDPLNPMFTGTPILRQKCEAANAHKSFALIFPKRTVDITAVTADQCKVLMEGFSALCFRLQVANLAGRGNKKGAVSRDEEEATTASMTLTNNSTQVSPAGASGKLKKSGTSPR